MKIVHVTQEMRQEYDRFIEAMPHGSFRQGYAWGQVMSYDQAVIRLAALEGGSITGVFSLQKKALPASPFSYLYAPRGPVVNYHDVGTLRALVAEARSLAASNRALFIRIDPDVREDNETVRRQLTDAGFIHLGGKNWSSLNYPRILMRLSIQESEDVLLKGMRKKHRQHINTLMSKGVTIEPIRDDDGLRQFYELMTELSVRKRFALRSFKYFQKLTSEFGEDARTLIARRDGVNLAGVLSLRYGKGAWYMHGATREDKGSLHPAEGLHWDMIRWARQRGCIFYDFGGTGTDYPPREDNPNFQLYNFKKGFGAEIHYLTGYYDLICIRPLYQLFRLLEERGLPLAMRALSAMRRAPSPGRRGS